MKRVVRLSLILFLAGNIQFASAQTFSLLKDINPTTGSNPSVLVSFNGWTYFQANDGTHGRELWKTNGTEAGTMMVKDISPLAIHSDISNMVIFNGQLYFTATDPTNGTELWTSDGSEAGTVLFKDINPGATGSQAGSLTVFNGSLYFCAGDGVHGRELWKSDGTLAGTAMVKDINPGSGNGSVSFFSGFTAIGTTLYFGAYDGSPSSGFHGTELWKTDGTEAGTVLVKDINLSTNPIDAYSGSLPLSLINYNGVIYFRAQDGKDNTEVWRTDGTEAGTYLLKEINTIPSGGPGITLGCVPGDFTIANGILFFVATNTPNGFELWKTDGTEIGTVMVKDINPTGGSDPYRLRAMGNFIYFAASEPTNGRELWKSDGTEAGTVLVKDINPGPGVSGEPWLHDVISNRLYFVADDGINGREMWVTDGTTAGTSLVQNIAPTSESSNPDGVWQSYGKLYMPAHTVATNWEFWVADDASAIPLPLTLLEFKGALSNDDGILQWKTDNELNTKSFAIERSTDGRYYSSVGHVTAANASGAHTYNYIDANIKSLGAKIVYYRLRQVDADNKSTYSRIVALSIDNMKSFAILYPNPVKSEINMTITLTKKERLNWQLVDNNGRVVKYGSYSLSGGSIAVSIDVSNISAGNYLMQLNGESVQQTIKIIKQ